MPKLQFKDRVVLVTGSAQGIGKNIARAFSGAGAQVVIADVDRERGEETRRELNEAEGKAAYYHVDLGEPGAPQRMVEEIVRTEGKIDILVNNARSRTRTNLDEETEDTWDEAMAVNLKAPFFASQAASAAMVKTGGGSIVSISSVAGNLTCHESPAYHITKAGLVQMTRYLAAQTGNDEVRVNAVALGFIVHDEHWERYQRNDNEWYREVVEYCHPLGRVGRGDDVARAVLYLCSPEASFITGQCLVIDGGLTLSEPSDLLLRFKRDTG